MQRILSFPLPFTVRGVLAAPDGGGPVEDGGGADEGGEEVGVEAEDVSPGAGVQPQPRTPVQDSVH